jgi:hypothetical protein
MRRILALAAIALAIGGASARANIVANGGFETETSTTPGIPPDDWTSTGNSGADQTLPNSGSWDAFFGETTGTIYQTLTTPGTTYTLSFAVAADSAAFTDPNNPGFFVCFDPSATSCSAATDLFGGNILGDLPGPSTYMTFDDTITATAGTMNLIFTGQNTNGGTFYLDDVDVEPVATTVPEPSALLVVASALGLLTVLRLRRA